MVTVRVKGRHPTWDNTCQLIEVVCVPTFIGGRLGPCRGVGKAV